MDDDRHSNIWTHQATIDHMTALVDDVLFLNQAEVEKLQCNPTTLDLVAFIQELIDEWQSTVKDKQRLTFVCLGEVRPFLADAKLLRQIVNNLIGNAIKYSPNGGEVVVSLNPESNQVNFQICDEGIGIPPEDQHNLFEPFNRASNVGTIRGTGLELSIAKSVWICTRVRYVIVKCWCRHKIYSNRLW
jgi:signal transduction histidine kinase